MNNKGITLISLTMYVVGITFVIIAVATLTSFFYNNIVDLRDSTDSLSEFDKFNVAFLKEVKNDEVSVINIEKTKITFSNGVTFQFQDNGIYRNYVKICEQIKDCQFSSTTMGENIVIKVYLEIGTDFAKTLEYVGNNKQNNETNKRLILTKSTEEYTNGNVIVTLNYINLPEGYEIQYKIGDNQWTAGTSVTVEENNTVVYGRIYNNTTLDEKDNNSIIITNIDKEAPTAPTEIEYSSTINSITVRAIGGTDNLSGVAGYQYSIDNINWTETIAEGISFTFSGLSAGTSYTIYARTVDNVSITSTTNQDIYIRKMWFKMNWTDIYYAEYGMTWRKWINSGYNTTLLKITNDGYISENVEASGAGVNLSKASFVSADDTIMDGFDAYLIDNVSQCLISSRVASPL